MPEPYGIAPEGFRLPSATRVGKVRLQVGDLARSLRYYEQTIGLRVISRSADQAALGAHGDSRALIELVEYPGAKPAPRGGTVGLFHFAILLPDRAALGRFLQHVLPLNAVTGLADHAVSEAIYLSDPDGLGIEVYADRPRTTWRIGRAGQLYMTTEALDVASVIDASRGQPWQGLPAGTGMGHVHLHVGDLAGAEAFYHRALGLDKIVWSYPGALFLSAGGYHHHLGTNTWSTGDPAPADHARLLSWDLEVPHQQAADETARSVIAAGYPAEPDDGVWRTADPWGTALDIRAV